MKSKTILAVAVAGTFAWSTGVLAGGLHHSSAEVLTPSSVSESAPWLAGQPHSAGWSSPESTIVSSAADERFGSFSLGAGASSDRGGSGSVGYDTSSSLGGDSTVAIVEYWLIGTEPAYTGASGSVSGFGSGGFTEQYSSVSGPESFGYSERSIGSMDAMSDGSMLISEVYVVLAPLTAFDGSDYWTMEVTPTEESLDQLASITDFYVLTPIYEEIADTSFFGSGAADQLSLETSSDLSVGELAT